MSFSDVSLLQIPEIPMKHILEYLEFPSILVLRKVCHDLRNFIDDTKPASHLTKIRINVYSAVIQFSLGSRAQNEIRIFYEKCNKSCLVRKENENAVNKKTTLEDEDFVAVFCKDFEIILRHQKTVLDEFHITLYSSNSTIKEVNERVLESVSKVFESMKDPLQVKSFFMEVDDYNEILTVLPYFDPKPLELITINESSQTREVVLNLDEISQLEQWKQAEKLTIEGFQLPDLSQNFKHFSSIDLVYRGISIEELILLKEVFLRSSTLNTIKMCYNYNYKGFIKQRLAEALGEPFLDNNQGKNWFFRIPDTIKFLRIKFDENHNIHFNRIEQSDVPQKAIILN